MIWFGTVPAEEPGLSGPLGMPGQPLVRQPTAHQSDIRLKGFYHVYLGAHLALEGFKEGQA